MKKHFLKYVYFFMAASLAIPFILQESTAQESSGVGEPSEQNNSSNVVEVFSQDTTDENKELDSAQENVSTFSGKNFGNLSWQGSMMFTQQDLLRLYNALKNGTASSISEAAQKQPSLAESNQVQSAPSFVVNSIVYYTPDNWSVWVNNNRIRSINPVSDDIKISRITDKYVEIIWRSTDIDTISPDWKSKLAPINSYAGQNTSSVENDVEKQKESSAKAFQNNNFNWDYKSANGDIVLDSKNGIVRFKLGLNQIFHSNSMEIIDGSNHGSSPESQPNTPEEEAGVDEENLNSENTPPTPVDADQNKPVEVPAISEEEAEKMVKEIENKAGINNQ